MRIHTYHAVQNCWHSNWFFYWLLILGRKCCISGMEGRRVMYVAPISLANLYRVSYFVIYVLCSLVMKRGSELKQYFQLLKEEIWILQWTGILLPVNCHNSYQECRVADCMSSELSKNIFYFFYSARINYVHLPTESKLNS